MRKPRSKLARKKSAREPYDRVLIVCEGTKTEPQYFAGMVRHYKLSTANIKVVGQGADPLSIVKKAKELSRQERDHEENYDVVFCVFDRDEHTNFETATAAANSSNLRLSRSWPCFEFWFLLHFGYTRRPICANEVVRVPLHFASRNFVLNGQNTQKKNQCISGIGN